MEHLEQLLDRRIDVTNNIIRGAEELLTMVHIPQCSYCGETDNLTHCVGDKKWWCDECVLHFSE